MSHTDAHQRFEFLPDGREYVENRETMRDYWRGDSTPWNPEWNSHWSRPACQQEYARQENRHERHNAKAALRRGDYDEIPLHMTGRHTAAWLAY